ncbi:MAG: hypothetical protein OEN50_00440 [Deltaproteobacteria bacterium]|nr:hypothetical protein [Deltaproteobacteria bacterium]
MSALPRIFINAALMMALITAACSTSNFIVNEWHNPAYTATVFKSVMIGGLSEQTSVRRNLEDEFLAQLRASGVDASPSYRNLPDDEKIDDVKLKQTARKAGADALLVARQVRVEQRTELGPSYYPVPSVGIFGRNVSGVWHGGYGAPSVTRYTEYTSEATLYDLAKSEVVWSATLRTSEQENLNTAVKLYVEAVIDALKAKNLLGVKK